MTDPSIISRKESSEQNCTDRTEVPAGIGLTSFPEHLLHTRLWGKPKVTQGKKEQGAKIKIYSASGSMLGIIIATVSFNPPKGDILYPHLQMRKLRFRGSGTYSMS